MRTRGAVPAMLAGLLYATPANAHVSEGAIVLILPTDIYIGFGIAAVAVTVILTALVPPGAFRWLLGTGRPLPNHRGEGGLRTATSLAATALFAILICLGIWGTRDPLENLLPLIVFTLWWICLPGVQALCGDIWGWINPWSGLNRLLFRGRHPFTLPGWLSYWPAIATYSTASIYTLTDIAPSDPARLALAAGGYWLVTFILTALFGPEWLRRGEGFTVFFTLIARVSPFNWQPFRPVFPGKSIVDAAPPPRSLAVFAIILLALGSFDGLNETFWWMGQWGINPLEFPGRSAVVWPNRIGMAGAVIGLNLAFALSVWVGLVLIGRNGDFARLFARLSLTLIPIAVGYHLAHYLTPALVELQYVVLALNDPFHSGASLFGLDDTFVTTSFFNQHHTVERIWLTQAGIIVLVHMIAVILSHGIALEEFGAHRTAFLSQIPVALFMVLYTFLGLWLLSSPLAL
jgi:hypothetical protein